MIKSRGWLLLGLLCALSCAQADEGRSSFLSGRRGQLIQRLAQKKMPVFNATPTSDISKPGLYTIPISFDGSDRMYEVHVPVNYDRKKPAPLIVVMHGGLGNMDVQSKEEFYHQISKSDSEGSVAIFPNGASRFASGTLATWNAGKCCGYARQSNTDDVGFIKKLVEVTSKQLSIDPKRVYATGMSNGGMMAYRLACEASDIFRAVAPVAGTDNTNSCAPKNPVSIMHFHAKDDDHVQYNGGRGKAALPGEDVDYTSVPATIAKWVKFDGCQTTPKRVLEKPGVVCEQYTGCKTGVKVELCSTSEGGHSWPGGHKASTGAGGTRAISANDHMWEFFRSL